MEDAKIIALFWQRNERAITEFEQAHKRLCLSVVRAHRTPLKTTNNTIGTAQI